METNKIIHGDSLEYMRTLPDKCIDLVLTDPPYFWIVNNDWDNQWATKQEFICWLELYTKEWKRILKDNWSLYIFWDDKVTAYVQVMMDKYFKLENSIVWYKPNNMTIKWWDIFRSYAPVTERLLFYSNEVLKTWLQEINDNLELYRPIRDYFVEERKKTKLSYNQINIKCFWTASNWWWMASNILTGYKNWWTFPTKEKYEALQKIGICKKQYEELRKQYEELRRPFNPAENFTDIWTFPITSEKEKWAWKHPTIKPLQIFKRIIETSSREWDLILDCFAWSWTTAVACIETGRNYIVIEKEKDYVDIIENRVANTTPPLFVM